MVKHLFRLKYFLILLYLVTLGATQFLFSQRIQRFDARAKIEGKGKLERVFDYRVRNGDTLVSGAYETTLFKFSQDGESNVSRFLLNFSELGVLDGDYYLETTDFSLDDGFPSYRDFKVLQPIEGQATFVNGKFKQGARNGNWYIFQVEIDDRAVDTVSSAYVGFDAKGEWHGEFRFASNTGSESLSGQFKRGMVDGTWVMRMKNETFQVSFEDGVMVNFKTNTFSQDVEYDKEGDFRSYDMTTVFKDYLKQQVMRNNHADSLASIFLDILCSSLDGFVPSPYLFPPKGSSFIFTMPSVKLPLYSVSEKDAKLIEVNAARTSERLLELDSLSKAPEIVLACHNNVDVAKSVAAFELIQKRLLILDDFIQSANSTIGKHFNWNEQAERVFTELANITLTTYTCEGTTYTYNLKETPYDSSITSLSNIYNHVKFLDSLFNQYAAIVNDQIVDYQFGERVKNKQRDFTISLQYLDSSLASTEVSNPSYLSGFNNFRGLVLDRFSSAIAEDDLDAAKDLISQLKRLSALLETTKDWQRMDAYIASKYRYMYLDPNTFVEREELLYDRIYKAYRDKLMPYVFSQLMFDFNTVTEFEKSFENISIVQQRVIAVLDEDPRKLNRKIKPRDNAEKVIEKMDLILN